MMISGPVNTSAFRTGTTSRIRSGKRERESTVVVEAPPSLSWLLTITDLVRLANHVLCRRCSLHHMSWQVISKHQVVCFVPTRSVSPRDHYALIVNQVHSCTRYIQEPTVRSRADAQSILDQSQATTGRISLRVKIAHVDELSSTQDKRRS